MKNLYSSELLLRAMQSKQEMVALWGGYQFLMLFPEKFLDAIDLFLHSDFTELQEVGIAKIGDIGASEYAPQMVNFFRSGNSSVKRAAAIAMARFPNDFSSSLLQKWFEELLGSPATTRADLETATYALLLVDMETQQKKILSYLKRTQADNIKSLVIFKGLLQSCSDESLLMELMEQYFILRDLYSDAELTQQLLLSVNHSEIIEWIGRRLGMGFSLGSLYEQCFTILERNLNSEEKQILSVLDNYLQYDASTALSKGKGRFISSLLEFVQIALFPPKKGSLGEKLVWFLEGFNKNQQSFSKTIPKIIEMEKSFLLSIPLLIALERCIDSWLTSPEKYAQQLAQYYHSFLLTNKYRETILQFFFPQAPILTKEDTNIQKEMVPVNENTPIHEVLWSLYRGDLAGYDIFWPGIFPNPDISMHTAQILAQIYQNNFDYYITKKDHVSVDYAMQLFQLVPSEKNISLILANFEYLHQYHTDILYQTIEYQPHPFFFPLLTDRYRQEEFETAELILFTKEVFQLELPESIRAELEEQFSCDLKGKSYKNRVRLRCASCNGVWQYPVNVIYIDEEELNRSNKLITDSVWVQEDFLCKKCEASIPFNLDDKQLEEIATQARLNQLLKLAPQKNQNRLGQGLKIFPFPHYAGKTYNPAMFNQLIEDMENSMNSNKTTLNELWFKQATLFEIFGEWENVKTTLLKIQLSEPNIVGLHSRLGVAEFKLSHFAEARKYFKKIIAMDQDNQLRSQEKLFLDLANYYLELTDSKDTLRSQFKVIEGKR